MTDISVFYISIAPYISEVGGARLQLQVHLQAPGVMAALTVKVTKAIYPYHTTLYENLFLLQVSISLNETAATMERRGGRRFLTWKSHSSAPDVTLAVESCAA